MAIYRYYLRWHMHAYIHTGEVAFRGPKSYPNWSTRWFQAHNALKGPHISHLGECGCFNWTHIDIVAWLHTSNIGQSSKHHTNQAVLMPTLLLNTNRSEKTWCTMIWQPFVRHQLEFQCCLDYHCPSVCNPHVLIKMSIEQWHDWERMFVGNHGLPTSLKMKILTIKRSTSSPIGKPPKPQGV